MTTSKKLMIVFYSLDIGGIERKIVDIVNYLQAHRPQTKVIVCLQKKEGIFLNQIPATIQVITPNFHTPRFDTIWFTAWLAFQIIKFSPTHILSFMEISSIPALIARQIVFWKKPRLTISEDIFTSKRLYDIFPQKKAKKQINLIKKYYPQATQILTQTLAQKKELVGMFNRNVTVSPNWLPLDFPPQKLTPFSLRTTDILFIGRIETQKNLPKFIDIVENLVSAFPNLKVKIVGSGSQTKSIIKIIKSNNLSANITVLPPTINPQKYYLDSKIFLLTSDYEGFPLTLTEAVSCGCFPICHTLPEIKPFFDKHSVQILFQKNSEAVHLIKNVLSSTPSTEVFHHYQNKLIKLQSKNISQYINYCLS